MLPLLTWHSHLLSSPDLTLVSEGSFSLHHLHAICLSQVNIIIIIIIASLNSLNSLTTSLGLI